MVYESGLCKYKSLHDGKLFKRFVDVPILENKFVYRLNNWKLFVKRKEQQAVTDSGDV